MTTYPLQYIKLCELDVLAPSDFSFLACVGLDSHTRMKRSMPQHSASRFGAGFAGSGSGGCAAGLIQHWSASAYMRFQNPSVLGE